MHFDREVSKEGAGAGISITGLEFEYISFFNKLYFDLVHNEPLHRNWHTH